MPLLIGIGSAAWSVMSQGIKLLRCFGLLKQFRLDVRVISVGNLQAGGAGKTPLVAQIANEAAQRGLRVCILSRGYRSPWEAQGGVILPQSPPVNASQCGDEPALLHDLCPSAAIGVGRDRIRQYRLLREQCNGPIDLVILDDGFQHWRIHKDVEVVGLTSAGPSQILFRDFFSELSRAHLLVWTKGGRRPQVGSRPLVKVRYRLAPPPPQKSFCLVTGVADPEFVVQLAIQFGYSIKKHLKRPDHTSYDLSSIQEIIQHAQQSDLDLLITGKDWVKWRSLGVNSSAVTVIEPMLVFEEGREIWSKILWGQSY